VTFRLPTLLLVSVCVLLGPPVRVQAGKVYSQPVTVSDSQPAGPAPAQKPAAAARESKLQKLSRQGPQPQWIWGDRKPSNHFWFLKEFTAEEGTAFLQATCDNKMTVLLNGRQVLTGSNWQSPVSKTVTAALKPGKNMLLVDAHNQGGPAGLALKLTLLPKKGKPKYVITDKTWGTAVNKTDSAWNDAVTLGGMGVAPWGNVFAKRGSGLQSGPRDVFNVLPGFRVELLFTVPKGELGSWVSLTVDPQGRLIASDQGGKGLCRITPPAVGTQGTTHVEQLDVKMTSVHGMQFAFDSLYCSVNGGPGSGLYRLRDTNGDDQFDQVTKLKALAGGGEHGPHAVRLSPDGKSLYVIAGNHTDPPQKLDGSRIPSNWSEDLLLPRQWDARGHARGKLAPGGWIAKTDPDGRTWEIASIGYRNPYDMAFNADGELFAYDADMEWDVGTPWYRPTRLCHAVSGSEFGWRSGTGKWPNHYADSLPAVVDIGPGSPVGVTFGYGAKFPAKYQRALYLLDWTFGTIYAIHLEASGASYVGTKQEFVSRTPLPLTDAAVGPDGAFYFTVGGRGTQSHLYRVIYVGDESTAPAEVQNKQFAAQRKTRQQLESWHRPGPVTADELETIWKGIGNEDRFIRYAARIALEHRPGKLWRARWQQERNAQSAITATIAVARQDDKSQLQAALDVLGRIPIKGLTQSVQLELLRAYALSFIRLGKPDQATGQRIVQRLSPHYPANNDALNRELSRVLVYLNAPTVISKTLKLMQRPAAATSLASSALLARNPGYGGTIANMLANQPEIENIHFALALRNMRYGWTLEQRKTYYSWLAEARKKSGGASYQGFIDNIRKEALANTSPSEQQALARTVPLTPPKLEDLPKPHGPGRAWTLAGVVTTASDKLRQRDFKNGQRAFAAAQCGRCHRFGGQGGATGPDLTSVAGRFSIRDLTEAIVDPSKVISDQYRASTILTTAGKVITGRVLGTADGKLSVLTDPVDATKIIELKTDDVEEVTPSKVSLMPKDLLNQLNEDEVLDLIAYLLSRGNPQDPLFAQ